MPKLEHGNRKGHIYWLAVPFISHLWAPRSIWLAAAGNMLGQVDPFLYQVGRALLPSGE